MRIRRKPWARPELAACPFFVDSPLENRNRWEGWFPKRQPLHMELGCGKGTFTAQLAAQNPEINYIAVDIKSEVLAVAKREIERIYSQLERPVDNIALMSQDIERIDQMMGEQDKIERLYINFCNPWPKPAHHKRRLTHPRQLEKYKVFLQREARLYFKTDDDGLFRDTLKYLEECGFEVEYHTQDLHRSGYEGNIITEHEAMFSRQGIPIKFLIARQKAPGDWNDMLSLK